MSLVPGPFHASDVVHVVAERVGVRRVVLHVHVGGPRSRGEDVLVAALPRGVEDGRSGRGGTDDDALVAGNDGARTAQTPGGPGEGGGVGGGAATASAATGAGARARVAALRTTRLGARSSLI